MAAALSDYAPRAKDAHILDEKQVHGPPEKKQKIEETNIDPMTMNDEDDELPDMTDEEMALYGRQVKESGGFDVDNFTHSFSIGRIEPISEPWSDSRKKRFGDYSKEAIEKYNTEQKKNFKFKEVVKVNTQVVQGIDYYITFKAEDASTGVIQTFQTLVYDGIGEREIILIRIKPISKQGNEDPTI